MLTIQAHLGLYDKRHELCCVPITTFVLISASDHEKINLDNDDNDEFDGRRGDVGSKKKMMIMMLKVVTH